MLDEKKNVTMELVASNQGKPEDPCHCAFRNRFDGELSGKASCHASCCPNTDGGWGDLPAPAAAATSALQLLQQSPFPVFGPAKDPS